MSYSIFKKVAEQTQGNYVSNDAIRAVIDAGGDVRKGALAVGMALGKRGERERRRRRREVPVLEPRPFRKQPRLNSGKLTVESWGFEHRTERNCPATGLSELDLDGRVAVMCTGIDA